MSHDTLHTLPGAKARKKKAQAAGQTFQKHNVYPVRERRNVSEDQSDVEWSSNIRKNDTMHVLKRRSGKKSRNKGGSPKVNVTVDANASRAPSHNVRRKEKSSLGGKTNTCITSGQVYPVREAPEGQQSDTRWSSNLQKNDTLATMKRRKKEHSKKSKSPPRRGGSREDKGTKSRNDVSKGGGSDAKNNFLVKKKISDIPEAAGEDDAGAEDMRATSSATDNENGGEDGEEEKGEVREEVKGRQENTDVESTANFDDSSKDLDHHDSFLSFDDIGTGDLHFTEVQAEQLRASVQGQNFLIEQLREELNRQRTMMEEQNKKINELTNKVKKEGGNDGGQAYARAPHHGNKPRLAGTTGKPGGSRMKRQDTFGMITSIPKRGGPKKPSKMRLNSSGNSSPRQKIAMKPKHANKAGAGRFAAPQRQDTFGALQRHKKPKIGGLDPGKSGLRHGRGRSKLVVGERKQASSESDGTAVQPPQPRRADTMVAINAVKKPYKPNVRPAAPKEKAEGNGAKGRRKSSILVSD